MIEESGTGSVPFLTASITLFPMGNGLMSFDLFDIVLVDPAIPINILHSD
jgi:hypothetical protein